jgi:AraC family transcriptional regulator
MRSRPSILASLKELNRNLGGDVSLRSMTSRAHRSTFQFHREFRRAMGETPKQYTLRVRLERSAALLVTSSDPILNVAFEHGFRSHEVFTRAFVRYFGCTPMLYRSRYAHASRSERDRHAALLHALSPCMRLFRSESQQPKEISAMTASAVERKEFGGQPILFIRRRVTQAQLKDMFGECFGKLFMHGHQAGLPIAGWPLARYVSTGTGLWTVDAAMPIAAPAETSGEMTAGALEAGPVAFAVHSGPYEQLGETHVAIERWMEENGYRANGAPWEWYVSDPAEHPDPKDWKTEVYWPIREAK